VPLIYHKISEKETKASTSGKQNYFTRPWGHLPNLGYPRKDHFLKLKKINQPFPSFSQEDKFPGPGPETILEPVKICN